MKTFKRILLFFFALLSVSLQAQDEITILVSGAMTRPMTVVAEPFEGTSQTLNLISATSGDITRRVIAAEPVDLIIVSAAGMDRLIAEGLIAPGTRIDLARGLMGMGMQPGGIVPDISTPDAFFNTLIESESLAYVSPAAGGTSGTYIDGLIERMGMTEVMRPKVAYQIQGSRVAEALANGEVQFGITFISELLPNPRVQVVGPLPEEIQMPTVYAGGISSTAQNPELAERVLALLSGDEGREAITAIGLEALASQ